MEHAAQKFFTLVDDFFGTMPFLVCDVSAVTIPTVTHELSSTMPILLYDINASLPTVVDHLFAVMPMLVYDFYALIPNIVNDINTSVQSNFCWLNVVESLV